jgi:hypothetical protein
MIHGGKNVRQIKKKIQNTYLFIYRNKNIYIGNHHSVHYTYYNTYV